MRKHNKCQHFGEQVRLGPPALSALSRRALAGVALIVIVTALAYFPSINGGFIWDDKMIYVTDNEIMKSHDGLFRFWCTTEAPEYHPITNTIFWLEWRLWNMNPTGYHVTNLILHISEALLIWLIIRKLSMPGGFLTALIFAVHPVNVESVAWIAQLKDMVAVLFFLLSILWYLKFVMRARVPLAAKHSSFIIHHSSFYSWYWLSFLAFVAGMLSKGSIAMLPLLLLLIIWWQRKVSLWDVWRAIPFCLVAFLLSIVHVWFQTHGSGEPLRDVSFTSRLLGAGAVIWFYLYKAIFPLNLSFVYPQWDIQTDHLFWWLPLLAALIVTAVLWWYRKGWSRTLLFAWAFFCIALVPVMGFKDVIFMLYSLVADHYLHVAIIAVIALVAVNCSLWHRFARGTARSAAIAVAVAAVGTLTFLTWRQSRLYSNEIALYMATLEKNPECWMAHNNLGNVFFDSNRLPEAMEQYQQTMRLRPGLPDVYNNIGNILIKIGRQQEAIEYYQHALKIKPTYYKAYYNLGRTMADAGQLQEAINYYRMALNLKFNDAQTHNSLGYALAKTGDIQEAILHFKQSILFKPDQVDVLNNLGGVLAQTGKLQDAIEQFNQALLIKSDSTVYFNLAQAYASTNQRLEAVTAAQKALELARSQGQTEQARQIEKWLNDYQKGAGN